MVEKLLPQPNDLSPLRELPGAIQAHAVATTQQAASLTQQAEALDRHAAAMAALTDTLAFYLPVVVGLIGGFLIVQLLNIALTWRKK